jgi:hypothetical protein
MRERFLLGIVALAVAATLISPALAAAQVMRVDSAVGSGSDGVTQFQFSVTSGPSGENPSGSASFTVSFLGGETFTVTEINCLSVDGNTATFVGRLAFNSLGFSFAKVTVVDNGASGDTFGVAAYSGPSTDPPPPCTPITGFEGAATLLPRPIVAGDIVVVDAQPKAQDDEEDDDDENGENDGRAEDDQNGQDDPNDDDRNNDDD